MTPHQSDSIPAVVACHKALAHPARLRAIAMLRTGELCACQLTAVLRLAPSTVSAHLAELRRAGLVTERKEGRWVHYALAPLASEVVPAAVWDRVARDPTVRDDAAQVRALRAVPVEELCRAGLDVDRVVSVTGSDARRGD